MYLRMNYEVCIAISYRFALIRVKKTFGLTVRTTVWYHVAYYLLKFTMASRRVGDKVSLIGILKLNLYTVW